MYPFGGIAIAPLVAGYFASVMCRFWRQRGRRPGWIAGVLAISAGVLVTCVCTFQLDLFMPSRWSPGGGKGHLSDLILMTGFLAAVAGIMPAAIIVERHQKVYDKTHPVG